MSYLDSGFNENLIRFSYSGAEVPGQLDNVNSGEILTAGSIPVSEITNALASAEIIDNSRNIIRDIINSNLNTQAATILGAFEFGASGAIQIGTYESGVSGDIRISPNGIVARNASNVTTFAIDGDDGSATFLGTVAANSIISCDVSASRITAGTIAAAANLGNANVILDGANKRIVINDGTNDRVLIGYLSGKF
jgi:hypothetical protein